MHIWEFLVDIHRGDWTALVIFYSAVVGMILFVLLQLLLVRSRRAALKALATVRDLLEDMKALESRMEQALQSREGELDARMTRKIDQKGDLMQERIEQRSAALSDSISKLDSRAGRAEDQVQQFRERIAEVESRIPNLFDRLDEFRNTLAKTFQVELSGVLNSFDNSMGAVLQQMKSDLQLGISRIEGIEGMVRSRERAERTLLGAPGEGALPEPAGEEEGEFEEWEQQAKELAESEEPEEDSDEVVQAALLATEEQEDQYPAEMGESEEDSNEEVQAALLATEAEGEDQYPAEMGDAADQEEPDSPESGESDEEDS